MLNTSIEVKTDSFDGPLSLLLQLTQREEMDIRKLDLTLVTKQYLAYLAHMKEFDFNVAGDYLFLAATLLALKSNECLSEEDSKKLKEELENEGLLISSQSELIERLEELAHFQSMGRKLWNQTKLGHETFIKPKINRKIFIDAILTPVEQGKLYLAMMEFLLREKRKFTYVGREKISIREKLAYFKDHLKKGQNFEFKELLASQGDESITNIVVSFISLLELARFAKISFCQTEESHLYVEVKDDLIDFDIEAATGFDDVSSESNAGSANNKDMQIETLMEKNESSTLPSSLKEDTRPEATLIQ